MEQRRTPPYHKAPSVPDRTPPRLSEIVPAESTRPGAPSDRRTFLANASALTLAIPGMGAALAGCSPGGTERPADSVQTRGAGASDTTAGALAQHNSNSRLDSTVLKGARQGTTSGWRVLTGRSDSRMRRTASRRNPH